MTDWVLQEVLGGTVLLVPHLPPHMLSAVEFLAGQLVGLEEQPGTAMSGAPGHRSLPGVGSEEAWA